jgi:hypothetical protein
MLDREQLPASITEDDLIAAVERRDLRVGQKEALHELCRRRGARKTEVVLNLLSQRAHPADVRAIAAVELGKEDNPRHRNALEAALTDDPQIVRRAAESLARIGDAGSLSRLESLRSVPSEAARQSVEFAKTLISYRLRLRTHQLAPVPANELLRVDPDRSATVSSEPVSREAFEQMAARLREELPAVPVSPVGLDLTCGRNRFLVFVTAAFDGPDALSELIGSNAVAAVVLRRAPGGRFFVHEYVLTHPRDGSDLALFGVRPTGLRIHQGEVRVGAGEARFQIGTVNTPGAAAAQIEGALRPDERRLVLDRAVVSHVPAPGQRQPATPRKLDVQLG